MEGMGHSSNWKKQFPHRNSSWDATHSSCSSSSSSSSSSTVNKNDRLPHSFGPQRDSRPKLTRETYKEIHEKVLQHFGKKFSFDPSMHKWQLPEPDALFTTGNWQEDSLQHMKEELNAVKSKLNDYNLGDWHKHTRAMNMAAYILKAVKHRIQAEFVTQAWCKFYEIVASYDLVPLSADNDGCFNSLHLCEAPGAFIAALNHYLKLNKHVSWKWLSTTLNPYYEGNPLSCMINDDRFILHTLENWNFGADFTGNLMDTENFMNLLHESRKMGDVLLVTADGSIDCQENPGEQEHIVSNLHYCEAVTALHALAAGGSFLLKIFTIYEHDTICLLYLLCCAFKYVHIYKPATSKEGNSEVYVVCLQYIGSERMKPWLKVLRQHYGEEKHHKAMFARHFIPDSFIRKIYSCAEMFKNLQVAVIERNIAVFEGKDQPFEFNGKLRDMVTEYYIDHCRLARLKDHEYMVGKDKLMETVALNVGPKNEEGSFNDRCKKRKLDPSEQLMVLRDEVTHLKIEWPFTHQDIKWLTFPQRLLEKFSITIGQPIRTVESSKFCMGPLLRIHNQALQISFEKFDYSIEEKKTQEKMTNELHKMILSNPELPQKNYKVINFGQRLWIAMVREENTEASIDALYEIADTVEELWRGETLYLLGYPMITQLNVGVVYLLSRIFEKVGFIKPHKQECAVVFYGYRSGSHTLVSFIDDITKEMSRLDEEGLKQAVLALVPINILCGYEQEETDDTSTEGIEDHCVENKNANINFHTCVTYINNLCVKEKIIHVVNTVIR